MQFSVDEIPPLGWDRFGSLGGYAPRLHGSVVRLFWLALNPQAGFSRMPHGWAKDQFVLPVSVMCGTREAEIRLALQNILWGQPTEFSAWLQTSIGADLSAFDRTALAADLEEMKHSPPMSERAWPETTSLRCCSVAVSAGSA